MNQLGIDISKTKFDACLLLDEKPIFRTFGNSYEGFNTLVTWLEEKGSLPVHICMEGTGKLWEPLAYFLHEHKFLVSVVNPARIKGFAQSDMRRSKTDKNDAKVIARFCRAQNPIAWVPPSAEIKTIRDMQRYCDALKRDRTREINRLQSGVMDILVQRSIERHIDYLDQEINLIEDEILELIASSKSLRKDFMLLTSIDGVAQNTAVTFLSELHTAKLFSSSRQLEIFCGITPRQFESGSSIRLRSKISKVGNSRIRSALYMPAMSAMRSNPVLREFALRLKANGKPGRVVVVAVMRKLLRIMFAVLKSGKPFDVGFKSKPKEANTAVS